VEDGVTGNTQKRLQPIPEGAFFKWNFSYYVILVETVGLLSSKRRIAHGVRPELLVLLDSLRRLFHLTASLMAVLSLLVRFSLKLRKTYGVIPDSATPECLDSFFDSLNLFHVGTSP